MSCSATANFATSRSHFFAFWHKNVRNSTINYFINYQFSVVRHCVTFTDISIVDNIFRYAMELQIFERHYANPMTVTQKVVHSELFLSE